MSGILSGIKVIDFGQYIAGPYAAMLLAEQGADVIKVERPGGEPYRSDKGFVVCNRSKKGITLNLKTSEGQKVAHDLVKGVDVVIENFKPGTADRLAIGYETIKDINPWIIYCSISGFGQKGPYRDVPGWEPLALSMSTYYTEQNRVGDPIYQSQLLASHYSSFLAAFYIVTALYAREMSGKGDRIDLSLLRSAVAIQPNVLGNSPRKIRFPFNVRGMMPMVRAYQGGDGQWFVLSAASVGFFTSLCSVLDHDEWHLDPLFAGAPLLILPPQSAQVISILQTIFYTKPRDEWIKVLQEANIPCSPVQSIEEFMNHPHIDANNLAVEIQEEGLGKVKEMNIPVELSGAPGSIKGPSPKLGQHTAEVLSGLEYSMKEIEAFRQKTVI
jgi:crotonobetainyl-CoA:carnitine CoA-transferase CaiB-like acyl-CoA transferase